MKNTSILVMAIVILIPTFASAEVLYNITNLGNLGAYGSRATAINNSTQIAGKSRIPYIGGRAFIWDNGVMTDIGTVGELKKPGFFLGG